MPYWDQFCTTLDSASRYICSSTNTVTPGIKGCCFFVIVLSSFTHTNVLKYFKHSMKKSCGPLGCEMAPSGVESVYFSFLLTGRPAVQDLHKSLTSVKQEIIISNVILPSIRYEKL